MAEPARIADWQAISDLYGRYGWALDANDYDTVTECLAGDVVFEVGDRGRFSGHQEILTLLRSLGDDRPRHFTTNLWILGIDGDEATCRAKFQNVDPLSGALLSFGTYEDALRREGGAWRLLRRHVAFDWRAEAFAARPAPEGAREGES